MNVGEVFSKSRHHLLSFIDPRINDQIRASATYPLSGISSIQPEPATSDLFSYPRCKPRKALDLLVRKAWTTTGSHHRLGSALIPSDADEAGYSSPVFAEIF